MSEAIDRLALFVAETRWDDIPRAVQEHARLVVLDTLGVTLAGAEESEVRQLCERLSANAGIGATVLARGFPRADARTAALLNATAGRSIELCEGHISVSCQGAVQILPGALALGESMRSSGRDLLTALIVGYDVGVRLAAAMTRRPLAHQNGQAPLLGAVAAGARMRGLDAAGTSRALRIGATLLLTPSYTNTVAGASALNVAAGMSGFAAVLAPELALAGFTAQDEAIEQALGSLVGDGFDATHVLDGLGTRWEIAHNHFRLRACCNPIYPALDALEDALAELDAKADDIERIDVATYRFASVMRATEPPNSFGSRYSLPHAVAALITRGELGYRSFVDEVVRDPAIAALRRRVHVAEDPVLTAAAPLRPARVTLTLKDGRRTTHAYDSPRRDREAPYEERELREKFRELAGLVLTPADVADMESIVARCDEWSSVTELTDACRGYETATR